jgi:hypothetical protein
MAHNTRLYQRENVIDITFNEFFTRMVGYAKPMGEGWYRIVDFKTTGYLLDRTQDLVSQSDYPMVYGCGDFPTSVGDTPIEPIIVRVTIEPNTGLNRHDHRVYSELFPNDEIYWTWDWGFLWDWYQSNIGKLPSSWFEKRFYTDATLFGPHPDHQDNDWPLQIIEQSVGLSDPGVPQGQGADNSTIRDWHEFDPNHKYFEYYRGFIYYRKDTKRNISGSYDWRNVYLARYSSEGDFNSWNGGDSYKEGDVVIGGDGWIYVSLQQNTNQNPLRYDAYNNPESLSSTLGPLYVWDGLDVPPTSAFAPRSMRRAWLRLWPATYKWFSPWANGLSEAGDRLMTFYVGNQDLPYEFNKALEQPTYFELPANTLYIVKTFSGENDSVSTLETDESIYESLFDIDLGGPSTVPNGPWYEPQQDAAQPGVWVNQFGDPFWEGHPAGGLYFEEYPSRITHPVSDYRFSFVNDNRIVLIERKITEQGMSRQGFIKNIRFGKNSAGNTFYSIPETKEQRVKMYETLYNYINNSTNSYPIHHLAYGNGWRDTNNLGNETALGEEQLDWPIPPRSGDIDINLGGLNLPIHQIDITPGSFFGDNDFGDNFIGNVFFGAIEFNGGQYQEVTSSYFDNAYLGTNVDGAFHGCKFKNSNRYNLFLHGMSNVEIDSSEASILETLGNFKAIQVKSDLIRDCYETSIGKSWYNSLFHLIGVNHEGSMAHNYVDSLHSTSIGDAFWYNSIGFYYQYIPKGTHPVQYWFNTDEDPYKVKGYYFESGQNRISNNFILNRHRGWILNCSFESKYVANFGGAIEDRNVEQGATYFEGNTIGPGIFENIFWKMYRTKIEGKATQSGKAFQFAQVLPAKFDKIMRNSAFWNGAEWEETETLLTWFDDNGVLQVQKWQDSTTVIPTVGPAFPNF